MFILYRDTRADGNENRSFVASLFYEQQTHFDRHVARPDRVRKHEMLDAGEWRSFKQGANLWLQMKSQSFLAT